MEFSPLSPPAPPRKVWLRPAVGLAAGALLLYTGLLVHLVNACAGGADSSGYLNHARVLASGHVHVPTRTIPGVPAGKFSDYLYVPLGLKPAVEPGLLVPTYPAGMPLLILAGRSIGGWAHACDIVIVVHALAGLLLTFALGRVLGLSPRWSGLGTLLLGVSPLYLLFSVQAMSDVPATAWATAAAVAAWRARGRPAWAAAAGGLLSMAVLIRPNNVLMAAPLCVAWWPARWSVAALRAAIRQIALLLLGGIPGGVFFCLHSMAAYGHPLTTGYGDTSSLFEPRVFAETLLNYLHWLPAVFSPLVGLALLLPWVDKTMGRPAAFLSAWGLAYLGFYAFYFHTHETWWYLRFVLPAAPGLIIGAMIAGSQLATGQMFPRLRLASAGPAAFLVLAALAITEETYWDRKFGVIHAGREEAAYPRAAQWLEEHVPPDAIIATMQTSGAIFYYTHFTLVRWDQLEPANFPLLAAAASAARRTIYAPLYDFETAEVMRRMPGQWKIAGKIPNVTFWQWLGPAARP